MFGCLQALPQKKSYVAVHKISICDLKRKSLLAYHALTGCDTTSQFAGIGKISSWKVFETCPDLLQNLGETHPLTDEVVTSVEKFVCKLYDKGKDL